MHTNKLTPGTYILTLIRDFFILDNTVATKENVLKALIAR